MTVKGASLSMVVGCAAGVLAQDRPLGAATAIGPVDVGDVGGGLGPRGPVVASLTYDGVSLWGFKGQDFESVFDLYDVYVCETFAIDDDAELGGFRSVAFGNVNPFGATDVIVEIYDLDQLDEICDDGELPDYLMRSTPGAGLYDGVAAVTDFGGQCLPAGEYVLRWAVRLDFTTFGQIFFFGQMGEHDHGGGTANDGFQSNPGNAMGLGFCFETIDGDQLHSGVNFAIHGVAGDCGDSCPDGLRCGDWDGDGDADAEDFFAYLDGFAVQDECADVDQDGDWDADDFFAFLDRFVTGC